MTSPAHSARLPYGRRIVHLQPTAPDKPEVGAACNGCGLCCASEPCPLGIWLGRGHRGACVALQWDESGSRYRCGALAAPKRWLPWLPANWARRWAARWISAGSGCDCTWQAD